MSHVHAAAVQLPTSIDLNTAARQLVDFMSSVAGCCVVAWAANMYDAARSTALQLSGMCCVSRPTIANKRDACDKRVSKLFRLQGSPMNSCMILGSRAAMNGYSAGYSKRFFADTLAICGCGGNFEKTCDCEGNPPASLDVSL